MIFNSKNRPTIDIVVLSFAALICVSVLFIVLGILIQKTVHPDMDLSKAGEAVYAMLNTIIGALVGFIGGRAYGRHEEHEQKAPPPPPIIPPP
jgi:hypothetical protein